MRRCAEARWNSVGLGWNVERPEKHTLQGCGVSHHLLPGGYLAHVPLVLSLRADLLGIRAYRVSTIRFRKRLKADGKTYFTVSTWRAARL